ncbi:SIR2 family protein [Pseudomonas siliginis]|uniref:SIR2 family protein n=1 Tax=Pseudomonas siliginis TaxID=2842346 RepID=UPI002092668D|nr:SIR2 family protein [Pseudomonas siliginis]UST88434.1 SIR2 family protein [Pseudomonas siliginis]
MSRKTLVFGNGLGMALNPHHFSLTNAMADVWNDNFAISDIHKELISQCLGGNGIIPQSEDQLDPLHMVISACKTLNSVKMSQRMNVHWLSQEGQEFPVAVGNYIHKVATRLHQYDHGLPVTFLAPLIEFIRGTRSHVATLNYDKLLYGAFLDANLMRGYFDTVLVDGMVRNGFSADSMVRRYRNNYGYYLHLHGSPLFYDRHGLPCKRERHELNPFSPEGSDHIVLTHVRHKRSVIGASAVLSTYWNYLNFCLNESEEIILFGYSGGDDHLNDVVTAHAQSKPIVVVEWNGLGQTQQERWWYWSQKLNTQNLRHYYLDSILDFVNWDYR